MVSIMSNHTAKAIDELLALSNKKEFINLQTELNNLTLTIIASSAFGKGFEAIANAKEIVCQAFTVMLEAIQYRSLHLIDRVPIINRLPFWYRLALDKGILDLLLSAVDEEGKSFTNQEIKEQALTFVFAEHETTGNLMAWTIYILMTHEQIWCACREEVDRVLPHGIEPTYEHLNKLVICEAILQETLRLYPPAPLFARECLREHTVGSEGHRRLRIPVGTTVVINSYALHRCPDFWPRPLEFDYTRWIRDAISDLKPKLSHPYCYLPFAAGPRNCIGRNFALLEAIVMLAMLVQRCNFRMQVGQKITPDLRVTMRTKYGLLASSSILL